MPQALRPEDFPPISAIPVTLAATLDQIMLREGTKFEDDPDDPGGATKCGISLAFARAARIDVDGDGDVDIDDIKHVDPDLAKRIIFSRFFQLPHVDALPGCLGPQVLDAAFNCGVGGAQTIISKALIGLSGSCSWSPEGGFLDFAGPLSGAVGQYGGDAVGDALVRARIARYRSLVERRPASAKYLNGWTLRALFYATRSQRERYAELLKKYGETP